MISDVRRAANTANAILPTYLPAALPRGSYRFCSPAGIASRTRYSYLSPRTHRHKRVHTRAGEANVVKSFRDWLNEGEEIYNTALGEFKALESQIEALEAQLAAKKAEVNQIAHVIGKPAVEGVRRVSAQLVEAEHAGSAVPAGQVARALTGRGLVGRP
jgi:hypothetical protein